MKTLFKIAKMELRNLFYSPVAWFLAIAFLVQCSVYYTYSILPRAVWQEIEKSNNPKWKPRGSMTEAVYFSLDSSLIYGVLQNLYLFIPLLTMGVISREKNNGTIRLLYSSPIRVRQIVLGKYLALMLYNLLLLLIVGVFIVSGFFHIQSLDYPFLLSSLFGLYLLICAYTAIGVYMSSLTSYQIISAMGSFIIVFILSRIGTLWQKYDFVRDLTYFLSISGRIEKMLHGLIVTKDVLYFVVIVYIFLGFTLIRLRAGRESRPWWIRVGRYVLVFASALMIGYIGSRPILTGYWDVTPWQVNTLHPNMQKVIKAMGKEPLEVTLYTNLLGEGLGGGLPQNRNKYLNDLWEYYVRFKPDIDFKYVYYYDIQKGDSGYYKNFPNKTMRQIAALIAEGSDTRLSLFKTPEEIRRIIDLEPEGKRLVMQLKYKGRTEFLRTNFRGGITWPDGMQISAALKRLMQDTLPKIYFATGDLERSIFKSGEREYKDHAWDKLSENALVNIGFDVDTVSLDKRAVPANAAILVLADPKTRISDTATARLKQYIAAGGSLFILGEPGKQPMLNPLLQTLGLQLANGTVVEPTKDEMPQMVHPYVTDVCMNLAEGFLEELKAARREKDYDDSFKIVMPGVAALTYDTGGAFTVNPLLLSVGTRTWLKQGTFVTDSADIVYSPEAGDVKGSFAAAVGLTRQIHNHQQRIIVCGDADFMSNVRGGGSDLGVAFYCWLDHNKFPIYAPSFYRPKDNQLLINAATANLLIVVYVWVLPALALIVGSIILIRRKGK